MRLLRRQPVTFAVIAILAIYMIAFGLTLLALPELAPSLTGRIPYAGPRTFCSLHTWGWVFLVGGIVKSLRLVLPEHSFLDLALHILCTLVMVFWAGSWFTGPLTTAMPSYTLIAVVSVLLPFIHPLADRYLHLTPRSAPGAGE